MNRICTLNDLKQGEHGEVCDLLLRDSMRRRLQDIGLVPGTDVECLLKSPAGDPVAYLIRGAVIALRSEDSTRVLIK